MNQRLVTITSFPYLYQAQAAQLHLQSAGIDSYLDGAEFLNVDWIIGTAVGGVKVQTSSEDAEEASRILEKMTVPNQTTNQSETVTGCLECGAMIPEETTTCPQCGWSFVESNREHEPDESLEEFQKERSMDDSSAVFKGDRPGTMKRMNSFAKITIVGILVLTLLVYSVSIWMNLSSMLQS